MAFPAGVETVTVSSGEPLTTPGGDLVKGHIRFVAPPLMVVPSDNYTLGGEAVAELVDGEFTIVLVAGDATDIDPSGWTYAVFGEFTNAADWTSQVFLVKANPSVVLADVLQPDASLPNYFTEKLPLTGGTMTGDIVLAGDPTVALHPATKQYTDAGDDARVAVAGDTMTGRLTLSADPLNALHASPKQYVDAGDAAVLAAAAAESVSLAGDTMSGPLVLPGNPASNLQAAPKQYVDSQSAAAQAAAAAESVSLTGDTMSGPLVLPGNPSTNLQAAPKQYVDAAQTAAAAESVSIAGDTMTGPLILSGGPSTDLQASTKKYSDDQDDLKLTLAGGDTITGQVSLTNGADLNILDITELLGALVSTGIIHGGAVDINGVNPIAVDVGAFVGYIVDDTADEISPSVVRVQKNTSSTIVCATPSQPIVWYYLNNDGTFGQQTTEPTAEDRCARLQLGFSLQSGGLIIEAQTTHERITQRTTDWARLLESLGSFAVRGFEMVVSPNGANMQLNTSASKVFNRAINLFDGPTLNYDRNVVDQDALTLIPFRAGTQTPATLTGAPVTALDPTLYDAAGVATVIPNPSSNATIHRLYYSPLNDVNNKFFIQYGQVVYSSLAAAVTAIHSSNFVVNPLLKFTMLVGYIVCTKGATNLSDPAQAVFHPAQRFDIY